MTNTVVRVVEGILTILKIRIVPNGFDTLSVGVVSYEMSESDR